MQVKKFSNNKSYSFGAKLKFTKTCDQFLYNEVVNNGVKKIKSTVQNLGTNKDAVTIKIRPYNKVDSFYASNNNYIRKTDVVCFVNDKVSKKQIISVPEFDGGINEIADIYKKEISHEKGSKAHF